MNDSIPKTVLLTGGSRGIGAALATRLKEAGHIVHAPPRAVLDLSSPDSIDDYVASRGNDRIDILINNAGINVLRNITDIDAPLWHSMLQVNLTAALRLTQAYAPGMAERGWGRVLNIASIFAIVTRSQRAAYSVTKAGLAALTRSSAVEFGPRGVLVNALAPGYVDTDLTRQNNTPEALASLAAAIPLHRMATPQELAEVGLFLVSPVNTYLTGQTIVVDGGFTCL